MKPQTQSDSSCNLTITLEIVPENQQDVDPALVNAIGQGTAHALQLNGCIIEPVYTGQRGGFVVDVVIPLLVTVWMQKDIILADLSELVAILTPVVLIATHLRKAYENRVGKDNMQQSPMKMTIEIDGASISIEAADLEATEAALKLANFFQAHHPDAASKIKSQSKVKFTGSVPKRQPRKKR